ncbi:MAG TPA: AsnC family transcriptional regulator [Armatimonadetes bacterium]|jgi:Lrp/AsnC family leucine-responsive transcriptional regulator|nr:Lrp/AsnC family transcriptional regulator [Armatimonadota bacterium]HCD99938.1 AsnC family transcriptional regulator [Armatimonadota bacterium]
MRTFLNKTDRDILRILQKNGRISNADLSREIGLSQPSTLAKVRSLVRNGIIRQFTALCEPKALGYDVTALTMVSLSLHHERPIERFRRAVAEFPEVLECYHTTGEFDFLLKVVVDSIYSYERFVSEKLSRIHGIRKINTSFVLSTTKHTTELPIP